MQVSIREARNRLSHLVKCVQAGEEIVITNRGKPVACLVSPGEPQAGADIGNGRHILDWLAKHPLPAYARRSAEEIDASIDEERRAWS
ncbi:MAG TPA: type II toxin-antitoxin system prevent-host-death family antitoxin [Stellaceae bacterium]|nr:type II toxin-antitoxin system prevent-host-death family antitoxin [Stellaceae bacterium]